MTYKQYLAKRNDLIAKAQAFLDEGKIDDAKKTREEIEKLDSEYEAITKEAANLAAMQDRAVVLNLATKSVSPASATPVDKIDNTPAAKDETEIYRIAFAKNMMGLQMEKGEADVFDRVNAEFRNTTQTAATHTVLVPESVKAGIWKEIGEAHPIIGDLAMTFVKGDLTIIKETTAGDDADWYDENTETDEDDVGFGELNLTGCELAKAITISWKLKKMSVDAFLAYITSKIAEKMGNALAKAVVEGKGKPGAGDTFKAQPLGIAVALESEASTPQVVTYDSQTDPIDYEKMTDILAKIKSGYLAGAAIYAKNTMIWGTLAKITNEMGQPMFIPDVTAGGVARLFGLPVKEEDGVSDDEIIVGNVRLGYVMNVNENMTMYQEDHVKARKTDYMGYAIVDGAPLTTKAFCLVKKATG